MSKHQKEVRRERKKTDRARRLRDHFRNPQSAIRNGAAALAAAAVIAAGTQAYADPVRFDNPAHADPGHFHWPHETPPGGRILDIALPASDQAGDGTPTALSQYTGIFGSSQIGQTGGLTAEVLVGGYGDYYLLGVSGGVLIPTGDPWGNIGDIYYQGYSELPEGQSTYLGVRFDLGGGSQYGWIGGVRTGMEFDTFAWGYETEVGVPIPAGIPEPGSLALLAFGALALGRRRA